MYGDAQYPIAGVYPVAVKVGPALENGHDGADDAVAQDENHQSSAEVYKGPLMW